MEEVLPQDIISGKKYYIEYWGRENNRGHTDPTQLHVLLKKYYGRIDEEDRGVLALRDAVQIQNGEKIPVVNNPFITVKPENRITFEEEYQRRQREGVNYYYKFFPRKTDDIMLESVLRQRTHVDDDTVKGLSHEYFGGKKRKTNRKKSRKSKKTKRSKKSLTKSKKKRSKK